MLPYIENCFCRCGDRWPCQAARPQPTLTGKQSITLSERDIFLSGTLLLGPLPSAIGIGRAAAALGIAVVASALTLATATPAFAIATYSSIASITLTITGVTGPDADLVTFSFSESRDTFADWGGVVLLDEARADVEIEYEFPVWRQQVAVAGSVVPTPTEPSFIRTYAEISSNVFVGLPPGADPSAPVLVDFTLEWSASAFASIDDPVADEFAESFVVFQFFFPSGFGGGALASTQAGIPGESASGVEEFSLLMGGYYGQFSLFMIATGRAESIGVPVPGTLWLIGSGLLGLGLCGCRRRA